LRWGTAVPFARLRRESHLLVVRRVHRVCLDHCLLHRPVREMVGAIRMRSSCTSSLGRITSFFIP
jgi:hypothetical protein